MGEYLARIATIFVKPRDASEVRDQYTSLWVNQMCWYSSVSWCESRYTADLVDSKISGRIEDRSENFNSGVKKKMVSGAGEFICLKILP